MELKETARLCIEIRQATHAWAKESDDSFEQIVRLWHECLKNEPYEMAKKALVDYLVKNTFPPTIADIYRPYLEQTDREKVDKKETIDIYFRAISNYPCYKDTPDTQKEYMRIIGKKPTPDKGLKFERDLVAFVREHELKKMDVPPLIEYMKGVKAIE